MKYILILIFFYVNILNSAPYGMGEAYTSYGVSIYGIKYNPASINEIKSKEFAILYTKYYSGLINDSLNRYDFLLGTKLKIIPISIEVDYFSSKLFSTVSYNIGGGYNLYNIKLGILNKIINYSFGENEYTAIDPLFEDKKSFYVYSLDVGAIYNLFNIVKLGISYQNINRPIVSLISDKDSRLESVIRAGASRNFFKFMTVALDVVYNFSYINIYSGAEIKFSRFLTISGGIKLMRKRININMGVNTVIYKKYNLSYAMKMDAGFTHYFGIRITNFLME